MSFSCSQCGTNGRTSCTFVESSEVIGGCGNGSGEIILFGVRVKVDPMRKSVSMNNLSQYEVPYVSNNAAVADASAGGGCYASDDEAAHHQSSGGRERKRGVPWTEDEHKLFLLGLQKVGKGDWRGISRNFVKTRTPTQVASHAQKYFLRRSNLNRRRRRSSLFDITNDSVTTNPMQEEQVPQDNINMPVLSPQLLPATEASSFSVFPLENMGIGGFPVAPFPVTVGPILLPVKIENPMSNLSIGQNNQVDASAVLVHPIPVCALPNSSTMTDRNLNQKSVVEPPSLSLKLSLSYGKSQTSSKHSAFQVISTFNNKDNTISVA